jgi:hypothetical protein
VVELARKFRAAATALTELLDAIDLGGDAYMYQ